MTDDLSAGRSPSDSVAHPILLYDGVCGLCNRLVQFILHRDPTAIFRFASLQSPLAASILQRHHVNPTDLDTVYVPIGMGSGICGLITTRDLLGLKTEIVGVVARKAPAMALSFAAGKAVPTNSAQTFADGMATRDPRPEAVAIIKHGAARILQLSEDEIAEGVRAYFQDTHNVAEGGGAAPLAGLMQERARMTGKKVAVVLSGGNIDTSIYQRILAGETPKVG